MSKLCFMNGYFLYLKCGFNKFTLIIESLSREYNKVYEGQGFGVLCSLLLCQNLECSWYRKALNKYWSNE